MNTPFVDMHCHSTFSDGSLSPQQLIELALSTSLYGLSITDHDTVNAYPSAIHYGKQVGLEVIPGVEFSALLGKQSVHILGYSFAIDHPKITALCAFHQERRRERNLAMLMKLKSAGMEIAEEELESFALKDREKGESLSSIGRPHIALAMVQRGYIESVDEGFRKYLGDGKPFYVEGGGVSVRETVETIQAAGGFAVIAHPHLIRDSETVKTLLTYPFDGIEVYYAHLSHEQEKRWMVAAEERGWLITGGSDFHGDSKPHIYLGSSWIDEQRFQPFRERFWQNNPHLI